jgi:hypothetical protein
MNKARGSTIIIITTLVAAGLAFLIVATAPNIGMESQVAAQQQDDEIYRIQETAMSNAAPVAHTGNLPHAVVFVLPIRDDNKIYNGQVTFTASKPIEVQVIHVYRPDQTPDEVHGAPRTAVINGTTITYSHLTA